MCKGAHRVSYELAYGEIPANMVVCHKCDNPLCVRPDHLFLGTQRDNVRDMVNKRRQTKGEHAHNAILTDDLVKQIRIEHAAGSSYRELAEKYGVATWEHIRRIVKGIAWKHVV